MPTSSAYAGAMLALTVLSVILTGVCAVFAYPHWKEWRERTKRELQGGATRVRSPFVPLGAAFILLFTSSAVFAGVWLYLWLHAAHPNLYWGAFTVLLLAVVALWWLLTYTAKRALDDARTLRSKVAETNAQVSKLKNDLVEEQRGFQQMVLKKDQECSDKLTTAHAIGEQYKAERDEARHRVGECDQKVLALNDELAALKSGTVVRTDAPPNGELPVELEPTRGRSDKMFLKVTNKGERQQFYAQCSILSNPESPKLETVFDLGWESGIDKLSLVREQTGNLLLATAWDDRDPAHHHDAGLAGMGLQKLTGVIFREIEPERWRKYEKVNLPSYRLRITVFGQQTQTSTSQEYILRPGRSCALEMSPVGDQDYGELFAPLQVEAFQLARELREWLKFLGPRPLIDKAKYPETPDGVQQFVKDQWAIESPWSERLTFGYASRFADRVVNIGHRFRERNVISPNFVLQNQGMAVNDVAQVERIIEGLKLTAIRLEADGGVNK